jgi:RNA polymerase sigma-70 factor (sigma-E family)
MSVPGWTDQDFDAFVGARMPALVRFAYALTGDLGHAEDIVQTALMKTYLSTRRQVLQAPEAYVRRAIVSANVSRFRKRRVVENLVDTPPEPAASPSRASPAEAAEEFVSLLAGLGRRQRTALVLRYYEDWTEAQVAEAMGISTGTVKSLTSRALATLRTTSTRNERTPA